MRKLLAAPVKMSLSEYESQTYQTILKHAQEISLNLMAVKVENRPTEFLAWSEEFYRLCSQDLNLDLLEPEQFAPLKKLQDTLSNAISASQLKMLRIAPWPVFAGFIQEKAQLHALDERLRLLSHCQTLQNCAFSEMIDEDLLCLAGKHTAKHDPSVYQFDCEWFCSTKNNKPFHELWQLNASRFEQALQHIPLEGEVNLTDYQNFVRDYQAIFSEQELDAPLIPATRLLAMRRPDQFIALTNQNLDLICQGFAIAKFNNKDFNGYWQDLILTMRQFAWWKQAQSEGETEQQIWQNRAILIDLFMFADEQTAENSNYLKLKNKPLKNSKSSGSTGGRRRTKESVEALVDRALAGDDIPAYLKAKRESIITEVQNGKSIDQVIGLLRSIFG
ncbi:hypothetical protein N7931_08495 [Catenovulum sp. 2E275]|uniref:hypothetical protein n=1 Tax=Catenovulum sp. 2E275 TaxID=2980497 RepID=UPI0021CE7943|nr:hypothetical protein [Catenovulum sp. 2E275]MCU4675669.1 hypothetical protein [Catenovulum sp. 2E275]